MYVSSHDSASGRERRRAPRARLGPVDLTLSGAGASLIDLSVLGALAQSPVAQVPESSVTVRIDAADQSVELEARVVRSTPQPDAAGTVSHCVALEFLDVSMDALLALSRLIDQRAEPAVSDDTATATPRPAWSWT